MPSRTEGGLLSPPVHPPSRNRGWTDGEYLFLAGHTQSAGTATGFHITLAREEDSKNEREIVHRDALLLFRVSLAEGDGPVVQGLSVHGDPEGHTNLIAPGVPPADGPSVIVDHIEPRVTERFLYGLRKLRKTVPVHKGEHTAGDGC